VLAVSIDLPLFNKGQADKELAEAEAGRTRARRGILENRILAGVRAAHDSLRLRREIAADYQARSGRRAEELREIAEIAYQEGELGILELLDSYRVAQRAKLRLLDLQVTAKLAEVEFDRTVAKELLP
jgi:cobalt-zinc-cadmium efflux system outer membrane protein